MVGKQERIMTSRGVYCIKGENEIDLSSELSFQLKNKYNVLDIQIFDRGTYWVAFVIYSIKEKKEMKEVWKKI